MFRTDPENARHNRIAEHYDDDRKQKHDDQLVPSERNSLSVAGDVVVDAAHDDKMTFIVVRNVHRRVLQRKGTNPLHQFHRKSKSKSKGTV